MSKELIREYPCDTCIHNKVCTVITCFKETEIKTTHPFIKVNLECTEYFGIAELKGEKNG